LPFSYGISPQLSDAGHIFIANLDDSVSTLVRMEPTHLPWAKGMSFAFESIRSVDQGGTEHGEFWDLIGFVADEGCTFGNASFVIPRKKFLVIGDSINSGSVSGGTTITHRSAATYLVDAISNPPLTFPASLESSWDQRGSHAGFVRKLIDNWATNSTGTTPDPNVLNHRWPNIVNLSRPGQWQGTMGPLQRVVHTVTVPGFYSDMINRYYRRRLGASDFSDAADWTGGWAPDLVIIASFANDMLRGIFESNYSVLLGGESYFRGTAVKDAIGSRTTGLIAAIIAKWPSAKILVVGSSMTDATNSSYWGVSPATDTMAQITAGVDGTSPSTHFAFQSGGADYGYGFTRNMSAMSLGTGTNFASVHFDEATHELVRSNLQSEFNRLANL
jgi:hypothetical protein